MIPVFSFTYAAQHLPGIMTGDIIRYGAILKNANTGRIIGHLQETGVMQKVLSYAAPFSPPPINAMFSGVSALTGLVGIQQNAAIARSLAEVQQTLGVVQALGAATLVSSVVGLGATVVSTAILMRRIDGVVGHVKSLGDKLDALPQIMRDEKLTDTLDQIRHALQRLSEVDARPETGRRVAEAEEARLDESFRVLARGVRQTAESSVIEPDLLRSILAGMMVSSDAVASVRLRTDGPLAAQKGAERHYDDFENAARPLPADVIRAKLPKHIDSAFAETTVRFLTADIREVRARMASRPILHETLALQGISGATYLDQVANEDKEPFLMLQVPA